MTYIALIRGVNVTGNNMLPMKSLTAWPPHPATMNTMQTAE